MTTTAQTSSALDICNNKIEEIVALTEKDDEIKNMNLGLSSQTLLKSVTSFDQEAFKKIDSNKLY